MQNIGKGNPYYNSRVISDSVAVLSLVANTEQHFTIPAGATVAVFSCTVNFYILANGQTAAVPAASSTSFPSPNTVPSLNPAALNVTAGNLLSAIGPSNGILVIEFYRDTDLST